MRVKVVEFIMEFYYGNSKGDEAKCRGLTT